MTVSVIIPCYDQANFLHEAIESALAQTVPAHEIVVVDDGSTDHTASVAHSYVEVLYMYQENSGLCEARRAGFEASSGDLLIFLDADDRLLPDAIENGVAALLTNPDAAFAYGRLRRISLHGSLIGERKEPVRTHFYRDMLEDNFIPTPGMVIFKRSCFLVFGLFDPAYPATADYDLYLRVTKEAPIISHDHLTIERRVHPASMSRDAAKMLRSVLAVHKRQKKYAKRSQVLLSAYWGGHRFWRRWYGAQLVTQLTTYRHLKCWQQYGKGLQTLLLHAPELLFSALRRPRRSNRLSLKDSVQLGLLENEFEFHAKASDQSSVAGDLFLLGLHFKRLSSASSLRILGDQHYIVEIKCLNATIGTKLSFAGDIFDTVFMSPESLLAYVNARILSRQWEHEAWLLG